VLDAAKLSTLPALQHCFGTGGGRLNFGVISIPLPLRFARPALAGRRPYFEVVLALPRSWTFELASKDTEIAFDRLGGLN